MNLIFEKSVKSRRSFYLEQSGIEKHHLKCPLRKEDAPLAEVSELDLVRHYTALSKQVYGVDNGFYPLGSCTMKYNPRLNEVLANLEGFTSLHPSQNAKEAKGLNTLLLRLKASLCEISGMDSFTLQPAAGAQGEFCGIMLIKKYHNEYKNVKRDKIIVPDSAHGTNPASANMCGYTVVTVKSNGEGGVDIDALKEAVGFDTAGLMLTNPNTLGLFDKNIKQITEIVHSAGGLCYYDGANLNAVMGVCRPGDMGFDVMHLNVHKTFSSPHGGGGPGSGPVGCKNFLSKYLPKEDNKKSDKNSIGKLLAFYGSLPVLVRGYAYILTLGAEGLLDASQKAVLNANYLKKKLQEDYETAIDRTCMHEFVLDLSSFKEKYGVSALDVAKTLTDYGIHPPTMYFPLIVHEALMFEPTETESIQTLDLAANIMKEIKALAEKGEDLTKRPKNTFIGRVDEVKAARQPILKYTKE